MNQSINKDFFLKFLLILFFSIVGITQAFALLPNHQLQTKASSSSLHTQAQHRGEIIVLIHGLMRTYMSMGPLKSYFEKQGYTVYYYKYTSARYSIHEHAVDLNQYIVKLLAENPGAKIHFITHSLGGVIIREALGRLPKEQLKNVDSVVMLAPPNQGSALAKFSVKVLPMLNYFVKPLAELSSDQAAYVHHVPIPNIKIGIIAGRFDAKVPPSSARLDGYPEPVVVNATHTFIMNHARTKELIKRFLESGSFEENKKS
ncbi:esterase/lipase family protein [Legionella fallonii]|uniref:esterase/lipase family protein n=1 Tax=Legionella fallonii TaxID=96230 RepID=UPI0005D3B537|nr:alpha/beta fold hydrolase [Legionella fallonii]